MNPYTGHGSHAMGGEDVEMADGYTAPTIVDLGSVGELTLGNTDGESLDASFPVNTPKPDLRFS